MDLRNDFDQTGRAWPRAPVNPADAPGQGKLFTDDYSQPNAAASEPVFWTGPPAATTIGPLRRRRPHPTVPPDTAHADPSAGNAPADAPKSA